MISARLAPLALALFFLMVASGTSRGDAGPTGGSDLERMLAAQDLTAADLETNRAGNVSDKEVSQVQSQRNSLWLIFFSIAGGLLVMAAGFAIYHYTKNHKPNVFILPGIALGFDVLFFIFFALKLQVPSIADEKVTPVEGSVRGFVGVANGGYVVNIDGTEYKGVSRKLGNDLVPNGKVVRAYVVADKKMVVAIEPK